MAIETKITRIKKRDGRIVDFDPQKITNAIFKALSAVKKPDLTLAEDIAREVVDLLGKRFVEITPGVEEVQDVVEDALVKRGLTEVAKAYILYRQQRAELRAAKAFVKAPNDLKLGVNTLRVLARRYLLKDDKGNVIETPRELFRRVAKAVAAGDLISDPQADVQKTEEEFYNMLANLEFMPNTPTLMNAGTDIGQLSACFTSEQPILTKEGFKPISTIRVGEEVVTHTGRLRKVTQVFKRQINEPILKIRVRGLFNETLSVTSEHPVLAAKRDELQCIREKHRLCNGNPSKHCFKRPGENKYDCIYLEKPIATPRWIPAKELEKGDFVAISFNKSISDVPEIRISEVTPEKELILAGNFVKSVYRPNVGKLIPNSIKIDGDFMRLLGYWLADGSLSNRGNTPSTLRFTFNVREEDYCEDVMKIVKDKFNLVARKEIDTLQHTIQLRYHSTVVSQLFENLFGRNFDGKDLPDWVLSLPTDKQFHLLAGLFSGDGCHANRKRHDLLFVSLSNENLARKIWIILNRLGYNFNIRSYDPKLGTKKAFRISAAPSECEELAQVVNKNHFVERKRFPQYIRLGSDVLKPIENVEETEFKGEVYNLEVGEDHSYVANGVAVHNCFVLPVGDSLKEIFDAVKYTTLIQQSGGGTGFSFSRLRPRGDIVMSTKGQASGPVSFMRVFDVATDVVKQGGRRRGANMGILRIDHPDVLEFITAKTTEGFLRNFNVSVTATDRFMEAVANKDDYELINPRTGQAVRKMNAAEVFDLIIRMNWQTGDPGMVFIDEVNRHNPTPQIGEMESTNPCGEQPLLPYESCNLASINLAKVIKDSSVDWDHLRRIVRSGVHFLDNVIDVNEFPLPEIEEITRNGNRKIGLGVMGLAEALIMMGIPYDSEEALDVAEQFMKFIRDEGWKMSAEVGEKRGSFPNFKGSIWEERGYKAFRNATVTTIAPTGTISIIAQTSSGIEPLFAISFVRDVMEGTKLLETNGLFEKMARERGFYSQELMMDIATTGSVKGNDKVPEEVQRLFMTALDIAPEWHVRMQAAFQKYTDNAVSKTINLRPEATPEDIRKAYLLAYKLKCKGITVFRYGSKREQVLYISPELVKEAEREIEYATAESEYAGGCPFFYCPY